MPLNGSVLRLVILPLLFQAPGSSPQPPVFRAGTELVTLTATVTNVSGRAVTNLSKDDFEVAENGVVQQISFFATGEEIPTTLVLVVDVSGSMEDKIDGVQDALDHLVKVLKPSDEVALLTFSNDVDVVIRFGDDRQKLRRAIQGLRPGGGTALYDGIAAGLRMAAQGQQRKKAMLVLTDGNDTSSDLTLSEAAALIRKSETLVYCLGIGHGSRGSFGHVGRGADEIDDQTLRSFSDPTGGATYVLEQAHQGGRDLIDDAVIELTRELRQQYTLGYYPTTPGIAQRDITVKTRQQDYRVRTRSALRAAPRER